MVFILIKKKRRHTDIQKSDSIKLFLRNQSYERSTIPLEKKSSLFQHFANNFPSQQNELKKSFVRLNTAVSSLKPVDGGK